MMGTHQDNSQLKVGADFNGNDREVPRGAPSLEPRPWKVLERGKLEELSLVSEVPTSSDTDRGFA